MRTDLSFYDDEVLIKEIRKRGYKVKVTNISDFKNLMHEGLLHGK